MSTPGPHDHDDIGGRHRDRTALLGRRRALQVLGGASVAGLLAACSDDGTGTAPATTVTDATTSTTTARSTTTGAPAATTATSGAEIPDETRGPFPADGSNGPNLLTDGAAVRSDITASFGDYQGTAEGVPTTVQLTVVDAATGAPLPGAALYIWQCSADGRYSIYEIEDQNYLRGVQVADTAGRLAFTTVFPGCYPGRWPHWHFEVYDSIDEADTGANAMKTSQIALPQADCETVYADSRYGDSARSLSRLSLQSDGIFRDGWTDQLATVSGSVGDGYTVALLVRV
jgi:protocatechuate 3,4-dioxygenase beta subunit